jgi:ABC-type multidrug transport system fused ATPase/permease subunit
MELSPYYVISGVVALAIGQYTLLSTYAGNRFVQRYKKLKEAFAKWQDEDAKKFRKGLQYKASAQKPPEDIVDFVREWVRKSSAVTSLDTEYWNLASITKAVLISSGLSVVSGAYALLQPTMLVEQNDPLKISVFFFVVAIVAALYYTWKLGDLTSIIARFETGTPLDEIVKLLIEKQRE